MSFLSSCWGKIESAVNIVKSAVTTAANYVYAARGLFFIAGMTTIVVRELGIDKLFVNEAVCDLDTFSCKQACKVSDMAIEVQPVFLYFLQALSSSLMVAAYSRGFWKSTDVTKLKKHFIPSDSSVSEPLSGTMKVVFVILCTSAVVNYGVGALRNYLGCYEELANEFSLDEAIATPLAISMTLFWSFVSVGVKLPDFFSNTYKTCQHPKLPQSPLRIVTLGMLGVSMGVSTADYLARFIKLHGQDQEDYIPALFLAGMCGAIFAVFTSGASLDDIPKLFAKLKSKKAVPTAATIFLSVDVLAWWILNTTQISGRIISWTSPDDNVTVITNSTLFKNMCSEQVAQTSQLDSRSRAIIWVFSAAVSFPQTVCMGLYMASLTLLCREENKTDESENRPLLIQSQG